MMQALIPIASALLFALTFYFRKLAGKGLSIQTAYFIETMVQVLILSIVFIFFSPELRKHIDLKGSPALYACIAGVLVTTGVLLNYLALKQGWLSKVVAITSPSQIIFGVFLGIMLAGESLTFQQTIGIILGIIGVFLVLR